MINFEKIRSRVTIRDILNDCGFHPDKRRMPCPIHGGNNPSSFSFTDDSFYCFSCGASGGLLDLTQTLLGKDRKGALEYLAGMAGIQLDQSEGNYRSLEPRQPLKTRPIGASDADLIRLEIDMKVLKILRDHYTWRIRNAWRNRQRGLINLLGYYGEVQYCDYVLEELDAEVAVINYEINMKRRELHAGRFRNN